MTSPAKKGSRPKCLQCRRELKPQFHYPLEANTPTFQQLVNCGFATNNESEYKVKCRWQRLNRTFSGHYGNYFDDHFCGQGCAQKWAQTYATIVNDCTDRLEAIIAAFDHLNWKDTQARASMAGAIGWVKARLRRTA